MKGLVVVGIIGNARLCNFQFQMMTLEEIEKEVEKERVKTTLEIRSYHAPDCEYLDKVQLHKLNEYHPFSKFIGNKKRKW
jgi:hypothetical protein